MASMDIVKIVIVLSLAFYAFNCACRAYENYSTIRYSANSNAVPAEPSVDASVGSADWSSNEMSEMPVVEQPDWVQKFARAENLTVQENMLNVGNHERFYSNELPQKSQNQDLRKLPVIELNAGLSPWNQTSIHPSVIAQEQNRRSLDD